MYKVKHYLSFIHKRKMHNAGFSVSKSLVRGSSWLSITCTVDE